MQCYSNKISFHTAKTSHNLFTIHNKQQQHKVNCSTKMLSWKYMVRAYKLSLYLDWALIVKQTKCNQYENQKAVTLCIHLQWHPVSARQRAGDPLVQTIEAAQSSPLTLRYLEQLYPLYLNGKLK